MTRARLIGSFIICAVSWATAQVRVWQGTLTLPTYEEGAPDPNPAFDPYASSDQMLTYHLVGLAIAEGNP